MPEQFGRHRHVSHLPDDDTVKMRKLKKRVDVIWIAIALTFGAGGAVFAIASSSADANHAGAAGGDVQITAVDDAGLGSNDPSDEAAAAKLAIATGVPAATAAAPQTWKVGEASVLGYEAADGRFCFEFRGLTGGCLQAGVLTDEQPLDVTTDYGPGTFHVYGLALDSVVAVTVTVGGASLPAAFAHNAFFFSDNGLGGTKGISGVVIATMGVARRWRRPCISPRSGTCSAPDETVRRAPRGVRRTVPCHTPAQLCILVPRCTPQGSTTANCCGVRVWTQTRSAPSTAATRALSIARS